jgi:hypothetical protein
MPFTGSHPVAVLPFDRTALPTTALIAGSMAPDVPVFLHGGPGYVQTHTLLGVLSLDALLGGLMLVIWHLRRAAPARAAAPAALRARLPRRERTAPNFALGYLALVVGGLTHIGWDEFTHRDRAAVRHIGWLHQEHTLAALRLPGYSWAQYASTVAGLLILAIWSARWYHRTRPSSRPAPGLSLPVRVTATLVVAGAALIGAVAGGRQVWSTGSPSQLAVSTITRGGDALVLTLVVLATCWHLWSRQVHRPPV